MSEEQASKASGFPVGHALVVSIANYRGVTPLPEAVLNDARDVSALLTSPDHCGYDSRNVSTLLDSEVTLEALRAGLASLAARAEAEDTVVIFFSGHGALLGDPADPTSVLIPFDANWRDPAGTTLSEAEFTTALARISAKRLVVLLDACHSGGAGSLKRVADPDVPALGFSEKTLNRLATGTGRVLIASSRAEETSLVFRGARNSLFTQHLLDALRGTARTHGDGVIRVFEVFNHVAVKVRHGSQDAQHPIFKASQVEDNFPIALNRGGMKSAVPGPTPYARPDNWKLLEDILANLYPMGPQDQDIWERAGGDVSRLRLTGRGHVDWYAALKALRQGGGGAHITWDGLIGACLRDFPHHLDLKELVGVV
ncbi:caspase family protein (plasmid) [Skermanella mucosa]|uniref:caspase family protein n=1 Tax=Skermanella mucosa TaxID=1789672 RepID=UPI00192B93CC|nr:caspase family protein [Skermanella mucosa]UEM24359.1 caspase family protein [Skermanella mucosa]